jgi:hypothetical protein
MTLDVSRPERIAAAQLARINPSILSVIGKCRAELAHKCFVLSAVGDEEFGHIRRGSGVF